NDLEYLSPVEVGNTIMKLDFDTGSSDLWVFSDKLPLWQLQNHTFYPTEAVNTTNATASSNVRQVTGVKKEGFTWTIVYGDGTSASGVVFMDKVRVGAATVNTQAVEVATSVSRQFHEEKSDGLLGLGFGKTNTIKPQGQKTFFENLKDNLPLPLFTVSLKKGATGIYDFGFIDQKKYTGDIKYINVNTTRGYWEYAAVGYQVGNSPPVKTAFQSIADTGTTLLLLPTEVVKAFYANVPGAQLITTEGGYVYPCESAAKMPDLKLLVASTRTSNETPVELTVPGYFLDRGKSATGSGRCFGGVQMGSPALSIWGDIFLKSQFVVFEHVNDTNPRIGFAKQ
ncbi:protease B, partial [Microthyrium microscopicum]